MNLDSAASESDSVDLLFRYEGQYPALLYEFPYELPVKIIKKYRCTSIQTKIKMIIFQHLVSMN